MSQNSAPPLLFDPKIRTAKRERAMRRGGLNAHFLLEMIADEMADRLAFVAREFTHIAFIGPIGRYAERFALPQSARLTRLDLSAAEASDGGRLVSEDHLLEALANGGAAQQALAQYDLIIAAPAFDSVHDLPGALTQMRLALKPDGLLLGAFFAAGSLPSLRALCQAADEGRGVARLHPMVDLRGLGDLMQRAGYAMTVVDEQPLELSYSDPLRALADLRDLGQGNALAAQVPLGGRGAMARMAEAWAARADERGRVAEQIVIAHMSGWAPSPDQPKPARRGSASQSLAKALKDKSAD